MCGIVCAFDLKQKSEDLRPQILEMSKTIRHRGPDWSGIYSDDKAILAHERLAIVDPASGKQPLFSEDKKLILAANGEIYNHRQLRMQFDGKYYFQTESDCEVILHMFKMFGETCFDYLSGYYACAIWDNETKTLYVSRDPFGVRQLYIGRLNSELYVCSEMKGINFVL